MAEKITGERQRNSIIALKALANAKGVTGDDEGLNAAIKTILWLEKNRETIEIVVAMKADPEAWKVLHELSKQFPGLKVHEIRDVASAAS